MTVAQAIDRLTAIEKKHGSKVPVYFFCPHCQQDTEPTIIEIKVSEVRANMTGEKRRT